MDMNVNTNPVYSGLVKINTIDANSLTNKPCGWYVRERFDKETNKTVALELGAYLNDEVFISIPVHFSMKSLFLKMNYSDPDYNYYQVPNNVEFGVATYTNKKTGYINAVLVSPNEKHPRVLLAAYSYAPKTCVLAAEFTTQNTFVLKKYFNKERTVLGFIAFAEIKDNDTKIGVSIKEGIPNANRYDKIDLEFNVNGCTSNEDYGITYPDPKTRNVTEYIKMPMFITLPPIKKDNAEAPATTTSENAPVEKEQTERPKKKWTNNKSSYHPYHVNKVEDGGKNCADDPNSNRTYKRDKYYRHKGNRKNFRNNEPD